MNATNNTFTPDIPKLVIHHVGGRSGTGDFPSLKAFEKDFINVMYDADSSCADQIEEYWSGNQNKTIVLPWCLSDSAGMRNFNINYDPYTSSLYKFNEKYSDFYYVKEYEFDYYMGDVARTMEVVNLPTDTLDNIVQCKKAAPPPDFLSIDTQGSELDILKGSKNLLENNILAIKIEVELHQLYLNQPLFGDISNFLSEHGFILADLKLFQRKNHVQTRLGFRGVGYPTDGEALFLKDPSKISDIDIDRILKIKKLIFLSTCFCQFDLANQCMHLENTTGPSLNTSPSWLNFVHELSYEVMRLPERKRAKFSDYYSYDESKRRFSTGKYVNQKLKMPNFFIRLYRYSLRKFQYYFGNAITNFLWVFSLPSNQVESIFIKYLMKEAFIVAHRNYMQDILLKKHIE
jgi:FkbM family methyltransferase